MEDAYIKGSIDRYVAPEGVARSSKPEIPVKTLRRRTFWRRTCWSLYVGCLHFDSDCFVMRIEWLEQCPNVCSSSCQASAPPMDQSQRYIHRRDGESLTAIAAHYKHLNENAALPLHSFSPCLEGYDISTLVNPLLRRLTLFDIFTILSPLISPIEPHKFGKNHQ